MGDAGQAGLVTPVAEDVRVRRRSLRERTLDLVAENSLLVVMIALLAAVLLVLAPELLVADSWMTLVAGREIVAHGLPSHETLTVMPSVASGPTSSGSRSSSSTAPSGSAASGWRCSSASLTVVARVRIRRRRVAAPRRVGAQHALRRSRRRCSSRRGAGSSGRSRSRCRCSSGCSRSSASIRASRRRRTWLVFPLLVLWANLHGSVILGAAIVSLGRALLGARRRRAPDATRRCGRVRAAVVLVAPWACVLASPYALDLPAYYRLLLVDSPVSKVIVEWQAPKPQWLPARSSSSSRPPTVDRRRLAVAAPGAFDLGVLALTLGGSLRSTRGIVWFALAVAVLLPLAMDGALGGDRGPVQRRLGVVARRPASRARRWSRSSAR